MVKLLGGDKAVVSFTAPSEASGKATKYQVKVAAMPILPYEEWDYCRDSGRRRNWWRATNCKGEPVPKSTGAKEKFVVTNIPDVSGRPLFFAVRSFDSSGNRSPISNVFRAE